MNVRCWLTVLFVGLLAFTAGSEPMPLVRDEKVIFELLHEGDIDLSEGVAKAYRQNESITQIRRVGLVKGDVRIRAAFRDKTEKSITEAHITFNDAYYHELAAYVISRYLGLNIIPPTVSRSLPIAEKGLKRSNALRPGSLQLWVENSNVLFNFVDTELVYPGNKEYKNHQLREIKVFDCIIGNVDRHAGNLLVDLNPRYLDGDSEPYIGKIWAIDHSRAFYRGPIIAIRHCRLSKLTLHAVSIQFAHGMRAWDIAEVHRLLLANGLSQQQIENIRLSSIEKRFQRVKAHLDEQQRTSGLSDEAFFSSGIWHEVR